MKLYCNVKKWNIELDTLIIKSNNSLWMWGYTPGDQTNSVHKYASVKKIMDDVISADADMNHIFAIRTDSSLWCMGNNSFGELGLGHTGYVKSFTKVTDNVKSVATSGVHTLILKNDGSVWSCGYNYCGQLGNFQQESNVNSSLQRVALLKEVDIIAAGKNLSAAIEKNGTLYTWGYRKMLGIDKNVGVDNTSPTDIFVRR